MASQGPNSPGTCADDATVGTVAWTTPDNAKVSDNVYATASLDSGLGNRVRDNSVRLVQGGTVAGNDKALTTTDWPLTEAYTSYGTSSDLWGLTWTSSDINNATFGIVVSAQGLNTGNISHYLKATNFGFSIPAGATINGIIAEIQNMRNSTPLVSGQGGVDHIRITVYYTDAVSGNNLIALGVN